ncbi:hypothetical protein ACFLSA_02765 [Bacteroidota bacterium]
MSRISFLRQILVLLFISITTNGIAQQDTAKIIPAINLNGPRVEFTVIGGEMADELRDRDSIIM